MDRKGILTEQQEDFLVDVFLERIKFNSFLFNLLKRRILKMIIKNVDNRGLDKVHPSWKALLIPIIDAAIVKQYELARQRIAILLDTKINFKNVTSKTEKKWFEAATVLAATSIEMYIETRKTV